jgi:hypothetical protein
MRIKSSDGTAVADPHKIAANTRDPAWAACRPVNQRQLRRWRSMTTLLATPAFADLLLL